MTVSMPTAGRAIVADVELNETDPERLACGLPAPGIARGEHHRVAERLQAAGRLVAQALVRSGDQGDSHAPRLRRMSSVPALARIPAFPVRGRPGPGILGGAMLA